MPNISPGAAIAALLLSRLAYAAPSPSSENGAGYLHIPVTAGDQLPGSDINKRATGGSIEQILTNQQLFYSAKGENLLLLGIALSSC